MNIVEKISFHCPKHNVSLVKTETDFICEKGCQYPIVSKIPRFVSSDNYSQAFGEQWKRYRKTQLDSYTGVPITETRLRRCLGEELWNNLKGKQILEAGCGAGRFTEILLKKGAIVTSVDLSEAVEANQENFPQNENHRIAQANILAFPFTPQQFDIVLCLGVVQHTPDPEETLSALYDQVKKGGCLVIDHYTYTYSLSYYLRTATILRLFMRDLPRGKTIKITERIVNTFLPLHKGFRDFPLGRLLLNRISPVACYYHNLPELNDELQKEWALLDTHDSLTDYYKHFRTREQILAALVKLGLTDIWCEYGGNGVEARGCRPSR